jgi:hypothetical protein
MISQFKMTLFADVPHRLVLLTAYVPLKVELTLIMLQIKL